MEGLYSFLNQDAVNSAIDNVSVRGSFITPGYWVALAAYCRYKNIAYSCLNFEYEITKNYASAIALKPSLGEEDDYQYKRKNSGQNYSELVNLKDSEDTDRATEVINSCIRNLFSEQELSTFVGDLCEVVGDLHDNVWSHGKSTGFSMAQKWSNFDSTSSSFEFALADCGFGFLAELKRVGIDIKSDQEAIDWCIKEGNSSKNLKQKDEWQQRLPPDIAGNPMPGLGKPVVSENHHMGLGLAKLLQLVHNYKGKLWLTSGEQSLIVKQNGKSEYYKNKQKWQGVVLACRFDTEKAKEYVSSSDDITTSLIDFLRV